MGAGHRWPRPRSANVFPMNYRAIAQVAVSLAVLALAAAAGCDASRSGRGGGDSADGAPGPAARTADGKTTTGERPVAIIAGTSVPLSEIAPLLCEASGARVLEEVTLGRVLDAQMGAAGLAIDEDAVRREAQLLRDTLSQTVGLSADDATTLVSNVRAARGLGDRRFRMLLERNAKLRALVRDQVEIGDEDLQQAFLARHGPKYAVRILVVPTQTKAVEVRDRAAAGESFIDLAVRESSDPSAQRGGLLDAFSTADPQLPVALRQTVAGMNAGEISNPIIVENGFAVAKVERVIPGSGMTLEGVRPALAAEVRLVRERVLMERLAGRLLNQTQVTVFDRELDWAWRNRARREDGR